MAVSNYSGLTIVNPQLGIQITKVTDSSADWSSVANSTYFYDKTDKLVHYKNSSGVVLELFSASGGLTYFTEGENTSAPNGTVYVDSLTASSSSTNVDLAIVPKGSGALLSNVPDNTAVGGNKRGIYAVDLQRARFAGYLIASGNYSVLGGGVNNTASGYQSIVAGGYYSLASGSNSSVLGGTQNSATSTGSTVSGGQYNTASGSNGTVGGGNSNQATGFASLIPGGYGNVASGNYTQATGYYNTSNADYSYTYGHQNIASATYSGALGFLANTFGIKNRIAIASGQFASVGDAQISKFILKGSTTDATPTDITTDGSFYVIGTNNYIRLSNQSSFAFTGNIVGKKSGTTDTAMWKVEGLIVRGINEASTTLVTSTVTLVSNTPAWGTPTLSADTTIGCLRVQVIGAISTNIRWVGSIQTTEVIYA